MSSQGTNQKSMRLTAKNWDFIKKDVIEWYSVQGQSLSQVQSKVWEKYGFTAKCVFFHLGASSSDQDCSDRQWKYRLNQWRCRKNIQKHEKEVLIRMRQHQELNQANPSNAAFRLRGTAVNTKKIDRYIRDLEKKRRDLSPNASQFLTLKNCTWALLTPHSHIVRAEMGPNHTTRLRNSH
jgi:hypothetical protein